MKFTFKPVILCKPVLILKPLRCLVITVAMDVLMVAINCRATLVDLNYTVIKSGPLIPSCIVDKSSQSISDDL